MTTFATIQIGTTIHVQGYLVKTWTEPHRRPPLWSPEIITRAVVEVFGKRFAGELVEKDWRNEQNG